MRQISSELTPILKFITPWATISTIATGTISALYNGQFYMALAIIIVGTPIIGFMKIMLMDLRTVYLDSDNEKLIVGTSKKETIRFQDIKEIKRPTTPPYIISIRVNGTYSFGDTLLFIHYKHPMFFDGIDERLKLKLRT